MPMILTRPTRSSEHTCAYAELPAKRDSAASKRYVPVVVLIPGQSLYRRTAHAQQGHDREVLASARAKQKRQLAIDAGSRRCIGPGAAPAEFARPLRQFVCLSKNTQYLLVRFFR